jgi:hypothetical protein
MNALREENERLHAELKLARMMADNDRKRYETAIRTLRTQINKEG